jgi:uronate dehydrogenase
VKRILITGAAGQIGRALRKAWRGKYKLRLTDIAPMESPGSDEECIQADLADYGAIAKLMPGVDAIAHFGGRAVEGTWDEILPASIVGSYNVMESAHLAGVKRVILASSNHAVGFYRRQTTLTSEHAPRPDGLYGVSKAFFEAMGSLYADKHGMTVACLRIGTFREPDEPDNERHLMSWISHRDLVHLCECCIEAPDYHYAVMFGISNNTRARWDNTRAFQIGYRPRDNAEDFAARVAGKIEDDLARQFHGGFYIPEGFTGNAGLIP